MRIGQVDLIVGLRLRTQSIWRITHRIGGPLFVLSFRGRRALFGQLAQKGPRLAILLFELLPTGQFPRQRSWICLGSTISPLGFSQQSFNLLLQARFGFLQLGLVERAPLGGIGHKLRPIKANGSDLQRPMVAASRSTSLKTAFKSGRFSRRKVQIVS
jgi:hypothetical protein